jgi:glucose/mannose transport system substrate-binding protein
MLESRSLRQMEQGIGIGLLGLALLGCSSSTDPVRLEVYSWWKEEPERLAFEAAANVHERTHAGVDVLNVFNPNADDQRERLAMHLLAHAPPATFTANIGADLLRWSVVDPADPARPSSSRIRGLTDLFQRTGLDRALPPELESALRVGPSEVPYGVPINIHRLNVLYYDEQAVADFERNHDGQSLLDIETLCPRDREAPPLDVPIAIGADDDFALILLAFESVLPALAGPDFYDALFRGAGPDAVTAPGTVEDEVRKALECVQYLSRSFTLNNDTRDWARAVDQVKYREAAFTVMGDWANGQLSQQLLDGTVKAIPFPKRADVRETFVFTSDTFPLPIGAENEFEVAALLETFASPEAQRAFSRVKGSIPARLEVRSLGPLDTFQARTQADFADPAIAKVLATSGRFPPYYERDDLAAALRAMTRRGAARPEVDAAVAEFMAMEPLLGRWRARLAGGPEPDFLP